MRLVTPLAVYALWLRDTKRFLRSRSRVVASLVTPLLVLVFLGFGFRGVAFASVPEGVDYLQYLVPGILGFTMLFSASFSGLAILADRDVGFLKEIMVAPVSRTTIVLGRIAGGATTAVVQATLIMLFAIPLGFRPVSALALPLAVVFLVLVAVTFVGFGLLLASQFRDSQGFGLVVNFVIFPLLFLSGALYPLENLPAPLPYLGYVNPLTYGIDGLRGVLVGVSTFSVVLDLAVLVVAACVMVALGAWRFGRVDVV